MNEQSIEQALLTDRLSREEAHSKLGGIYQLLRDFQQAYPRTYQYICAQGQDVTLADALQALEDSVEFFK